MNNILIIIIGWIVFLSIAGYIVTFIIKEFVAMVKSEATLYKRTKSYKQRLRRNNSEVIAMALNNVIHDYWKVKKSHPDCDTWVLSQWLDYYTIRIRKEKEKENAKEA